MQTDHSPVFILSCERSGSTLLRMIIDAHPEIACPPQLNLGQACKHLYNLVYYSIGQTYKGDTESDRRQWVISEIQKMVGSVMQRYADNKKKKRWCEKTTLNINYIKLLSEIFPNARYICLYRYSMDVIYSCLKFNTLGFMSELSPYVRDKPGNLVDAMALNWLDKNEKILEFEKENPDKCFRVHYEDIVAQPNEILESTFRSIGVEWRKDILNKVFSSHHDLGPGDLKVVFSEKINTNSIGRGKMIPVSSISNVVYQHIDQVNERLGYKSLREFYEKEKATDGNISIEDSRKIFNEHRVLENFFLQHTDEILTKQWIKMDQLRGMCRFDVSEESWIVNLTIGSAEIRRSLEEDNEDCVITIVKEAFCQLVNGVASVGEIYERGEISASGNINLALQFGKLVFEHLLIKKY